jgi:DnaJ-class molecular chaperone
MESESCRICGGDGRITNSFGGSSKTCPGCHGTGRRSNEPLWHDVTKTKASHHQPTNRAVKEEKQTWPSTASGAQLATSVKNSGLAEDTKTRLVREIIEYEASHGSCTKTFERKIRKQL